MTSADLTSAYILCSMRHCFVMVSILRRIKSVIQSNYFQSFHSTFISMAWRSKGVDNADLIDQLKANSVIKTRKVKEIMTETDRKYYCTHDHYKDEPQNIGNGVTISAPHMHAYALELLLEKFKKGGRALDVGSGSGYLTACLARANRKAGGDKEGKIVVGIEHQPELVELGRKNIHADDSSLIENGDLIIVEGDGRHGHPEYAPYDIIHVGAAAPKAPQALLDQLKNNGRLICPVGPQHDSQFLEQYDKDENGEVSKTQLMSVLYVPLTDLNGFSP